MLIENLFRKQSSPWEKLCIAYVERAETIIRNFNVATWNCLVADEKVRNGLISEQDKFERHIAEAARKELQKILNDERGGILQTINHYFADTLNKTREERVLARLKKMGLHDGQNNVSMEQLLGTVHLSNEDQAVNDIHDILKAYYKTALKRFQDQVLKAVVERHLLGIEGTVGYLNT